MAWTQADLDQVRTNIASGVLQTRFADGREVRYQSLDHLIAAERVIANALALADQQSAGFQRRKFAKYRSGF